ncbi:type VI secretion system-associated FHA domain protein TagH [Massilia sp. LjRoot122]|uniref:type VI secretion system-associated FHA domain protein TagH n=1 Tax=Massilia sp. LjRoot122 TaxID=3342257 RepID=UPI003ED00B37
MQLTFRILTYRNQPVPPAPPVCFGAEGGSIGRSGDNALVLDDPSKYISRIHARVTVRNGSFVLEDLGSNASVVNDQPLGKGRQVALGHGDRVLIGDYLLQAVVNASPATPLLAQAPVNDPALPLFEPPPPVAPAPLPPLEPEVAPVAMPAASAPTVLDTFAGAGILDVVAGPQDAASDPLGLNLFGSPSARPARAADSDHVSPELAAIQRAAPVSSLAVPPRPAGVSAGFAIPHDYDPLADFFAPPAALAPVASPEPSPCRPDPVQAPRPVQREAAEDARTGAAAVLADANPLPARPPASGDPDGDAVMAALLRGLGLPDLQLRRPPAEVAEMVGAMLRVATAGTIDVLMARALTKKESRIDMTMLSVNANNPLKFFPNADGALTQMLVGAMPGYMDPVQAMSGAFDDLRAHELAVIAGMRAALAAVLHRFDPARIEERLAVPTVMDKMLSSSRKAKMWDRLVELYGEIAREADDDLQRLYGEKFSEAYEEQVARLRQTKR